MHPSIVRQMFSIWYIPELDLLATRHNNKLAAFVSPVPNPRAVAVDALPIPCAYSPTALMQQVFDKLVHSDQCRMLLVAPLQHYQPWLPMLLWLLVDFPRKVPHYHGVTVSARQLEHLPPVSMSVNGKSMRVGVVQNRLVLSKPLFSN